MNLKIALLFLLIFIFVVLGGLEWLAMSGATTPSPIDPQPHSSNPFCAETPVSCQRDEDCAACTSGSAVRFTCADQSGQKYCLPQTPDRPCKRENGGRWLYTGWGRIDPDIANEWQCQCAFANVAGKVGCDMNDDVCRGGSWVDQSWETHPPNPNACVCPEGTILIVRDGIKPMCLPQSSLCYDRASCEANFNN